MPQRPDKFTLNRTHHLAKGLMFAGLGAMAGGTHYHDSSVYGRHGQLDANASYGYAMGTRIVEHSASQPTSVQISGKVISVSACAISFWYRFNDNAGTTAKQMFYLNTGGSNQIIEMRTYTDGNTYCYWSTGVRNRVFPTLGQLAREWHHYVWQAQSNGYASLYYDGAYKGQVAIGTTVDFSSYTANVGDGLYAGRGAHSSFLVHDRLLSTTEIEQLADPSNVMLSGLILPPARRWWPVVSGGGPAASTIPVFMHHRRLMGAA